MAANQGKDKEVAPPIPLIDPTANVIKLVDAAMARQDDLRAAFIEGEEKLRTAQFSRIDNVRDAQFKRVDDLLALRERYFIDIQNLHLACQKELTAAESKRIDAITLAESRRIDALLAANTNNVALAAEKTSAQAATLATQVQTSAEALRNQVAATAVTTTQLITQLRESLEGRLTKVEQNQYQGVGLSVRQGEGRQISQWTIGIIVIVAMALMQLAGRMFVK